MRFIFALLLSATITTTYAQKIVKDEVDKFTHIRVVETSYESLARSGSASLKVRVSKRKSDDLDYTYLELRITKSSAFGVMERRSPVYLVTTSGKSIKLSCVRGGVSDHSGGSWVLYARYRILDGDLLALRNETITDIRVDFLDTYRSFKVKEKRRMIIAKSLQLLPSL